MSRRDVDRPDIQAFAYTAFGSLTGAAYLLLRVVDAPAARRFLGALETRLGRGPRARRTSSREATQCAITAGGLEGARRRPNPSSSASIRSSSRAWPATRTARCGSATSAPMRPDNWAWGVGEREPHVLVMLFAGPGAASATSTRETREAAERERACRDRDRCRPPTWATSSRSASPTAISQPTFDWDHARTPGTKADRAFTNRIALGEILLGYYNEYGFPAELAEARAGRAERGAPASAAGAAREHDLGRNGSYLVFRQLAQDVRGFWRWVAEEAERAGADPQALAEAMVGRRMDGAPLARFRNRPRPSRRRSGRPRRQRLPVRRRPGRPLLPDRRPYPARQSAHRRRPSAASRAPIDNLLATLGLTTRRQRDPTSSTLPWEKNTTVWPYLRHEDDAIASARFHRILRRGREYGTQDRPRGGARSRRRRTPRPGFSSSASTPTSPASSSSCRAPGSPTPSSPA